MRRKRRRRRKRTRSDAAEGSVTGGREGRKASYSKKWEARLDEWVGRDSNIEFNYF